MAQSCHALALLADLKVQGGGDLADSALEKLIDIASELIEDYLGRSGRLLFEMDVLEMPDLGAYASSRNLQAVNFDLYLRRPPIYSVGSLYVSGVVQTVKVVEADDLPLTQSPSTVFRTGEWDERGSLFRYGGWPVGVVAVTYSGGFKGPLQCEVPDDVKELPGPITEATILTALRLAGIVSRDGDLDLVSETTVGGWEQKWGGGSTSRAGLIPDSAKLALSRYRKRWRIS